ncbi:MAG: glycosyltransferase [Chitinophagaceae bacterium]|nr:MAG: glycosyltransferase [Chitinophagaceae bacterium]
MQDSCFRGFARMETYLAEEGVLIVGDGEERTSLEAMAKDCPGITFLGFQDKSMVPYYFNVADAFVFASRYDGWGLIINEAIAASLPVICSRQTGAAIDKLDNGKAILLDAEDVEGYSRAMEDMVTGKLNRWELISRTNQIAEEFSSEYNARQLYNICTAAE